jgi:hypothetical protein
MYGFRTSPLLLLVLPLFAGAGCDDGVRPDPIAEVRVTAPVTDLVIGDPMVLVGTVLTSSGRTVSDTTVQWTSADSTIATVDEDGVVRGIRPGRVQIIASVGEIAGGVDLAVRYPAIRAVVVRPDGYTVGANRHLALEALIVTELGDTLRGYPLEWISSDPSVVEIVGPGDVLGVTGGVAAITATAGEVEGSATVYVGAPVGSILLTPPGTSTLRPGQRLTIQAELREAGPGSRPLVTGTRAIQWTSSEPAIATVSEAGEVLALSPGRSVITAHVEERSNVVYITVLGDIATMKAQQDTLTMTVGASTRIFFSAWDVRGESIRDAVFSMRASPEGVLTFTPPSDYGSAGPDNHAVSSSVVTAVARGTADLIISSGPASDTIKVSAIPPVATVEIVAGGGRLSVGEELQLTAVVKSATGEVLENRVVTWESRSLDIAHVRPDGTAVGLSPGVTVVVARSERIEATAAITVIGPAPSREKVWLSVAAGDGHTCALDVGRKAWCWGRNQFGQLGTGTLDARSFPQRVMHDLQFEQISAGGAGTCGVALGGDAFCWGSGSGSGGTFPAPYPEAWGHKFRSVQVGERNSGVCGLELSGAAHCWAFRWWTASVLSFTMPGPFEALTVSQPCGLSKEGTVSCWGVRSHVAFPKKVDATRLIDLTSNLSAACGRDPERRVYCSSSIVFGSGGGYSVDEFKLIPGDLTFDQISAGGAQACGVTATTKRVYCWSLSSSGGGSVSPVVSGTPSLVSSDIEFKQVSVGADHACGVSVTGALYCWGSNSSGQLGVGVTGGSSVTPARVLDP